MVSDNFENILELVSSDRLRPSTRGTQNALIESESDKGRVVNHASFRRLLGKAQVFPLDTNAAVRTRLTHSIEVSQVGRYIAQKIIEWHSVNDGSYMKLAAFVNVIETACLLHDIGNPPFGHFGEAAIREWFKGRVDVPDLQCFDGNPQGFRLISFLNGADDYGLNLTCTLLLSTVKYPWTHESKPEDEKKVGLFTSDVEYYERACESLSWIPGKKFPFLQIMDAADGISYAMSDLEDGIEKGIVSIRDLEEEFGPELFPSGKVARFVRFKTNVISEAVSHAARAFIDNVDDILAGKHVDLIDEGSDVGRLLAKVTSFARSKIYASEAAERIELAGRSAVAGLLKHFDEVMQLSEDDFVALLENDRKSLRGKGLDYQQRLLRRLPEAYVSKYRVKRRDGSEELRRAHLIVDFISGMTDDFALEMYQVLEGIRIR